MILNEENYYYSFDGGGGAFFFLLELQMQIFLSEIPYLDYHHLRKI